MLIVTGPGGHVVDEVRLDGGRLAYQTGRAREVVESPRTRMTGRDLTDQQLYDLATGWSNGYLSISGEQDGPAG